jgi:hypothetical protein
MGVLPWTSRVLVDELEVKYRTDTRPIETDELVRCDCCGRPAENGHRRRYAKQQVAFGIPLRTLDWGENAYYRECLSPGSDVEPKTERRPERKRSLGLERRNR